MRLHTDKLTPIHLTMASDVLPGVYVTYREHGSRIRERAFEVQLEGNGYARNSGQYGADTDSQGATWDEWGVFIARLYAIDPDALWGSGKYPVYRNAEHFHACTANRFKDGTLPKDTHRRHNWKWKSQGSASLAMCSKCTAQINR